MRLSLADPTMVLLVGPSGSGKSTFAQAHFSSTEVVSSDALRAMLADDPTNQDASAEAFRILALLANGRLKRRLMTVIDATNLRAIDRKRLRHLAARYGIPSVAIAFDLPLEIYMRNNQRRPDRIVAVSVVSDQVERMREAMTDLESEENEALVVLREEDDLASVSIERRPRAVD